MLIKHTKNNFEEKNNTLNKPRRLRLL